MAPTVGSPCLLLQFSSQNPHGDTQLFLTIAAGSPVPSPDPQAPSTDVMHVQVFRQNIQTHRNTIIWVTFRPGE